MSGTDPAASLPSLLQEHRSGLLRFVKRRAGALLRYETAEDLVQGIHLRAIEAGSGFRFHGDREFHAWLATLARHYLANRREYWGAVRRDAGAMLRWSAGFASTGRARLDRAVSAPGPVTVASLREQIEIAMRAVKMLLPRDREIVRFESEGISIEEVAARLGLPYKTAQKARLRAIERFRKTFELASRANSARRFSRG